MSSVVIRVVLCIIEVRHSKLAVVDHIPRVVLWLHGVLELLTAEGILNFILFINRFEVFWRDVVFTVVGDVNFASFTFSTSGTWATSFVGILTNVPLPLFTCFPG